MSKWLDRLADLPENRQQTKPALSKLTESNSVGVVGAELVEF